MKIYAMVEFDLEQSPIENLSDEVEKIKEEIDGEFVKVKSGVYENLLMGTIISVKTREEILK